MFAVELKFELGAPSKAEDQADAITWLTAALARNGNLLEEFLVISDSNGWTVYGIIPAQDAFHRAHWNNLVLQRMSALRSVKLKRPRIRVLGAVPETATQCRCTAPKGFFLFTTFLHVEPPLWCIDCNGIVPLYRLPPSHTGEHSGLLAWQSNYQACDALQMSSTVGERFGTRQMSDLASELSRSGLAVCKDLKRLTSRPVYYYLYRESTRSHTVELRRKCPSCGGPWRLKEPLHAKFDFKCDKCRLLSNIAWSVR
jgi:predicted  nucleic acid-binding Zn ribbon protein